VVAVVMAVVVGVVMGSSWSSRGERR
jgi:hypothetical protein